MELSFNLQHFCADERIDILLNWLFFLNFLIVQKGI